TTASNPQRTRCHDRPARRDRRDPSALPRARGPDDPRGRPGAAPGHDPRRRGSCPPPPPPPRTHPPRLAPPHRLGARGTPPLAPRPRGPSPPPPPASRSTCTASRPSSGCGPAAPPCWPTPTPSTQRRASSPTTMPTFHHLAPGPSAELHTTRRQAGDELDV